MLSKIIRFFRDVRSFRATMAEWLGDGGGPVAHTLAQQRANQCRWCQFNHESGTAKGAVGEAVRRQMAAKGRLGFRVSCESDLGECSLCRCWLPLKIHVPHAHIRRHQREEVRQAIKAGKPDCWQLFSDR